MTSILRHPSIAILMGVIPNIPDIYIVFELVDQGSLFDLQVCVSPLLQPPGVRLAPGAGRLITAVWRR